MATQQTSSNNNVLYNRKTRILQRHGLLGGGQCTQSTRSTRTQGLPSLHAWVWQQHDYATEHAGCAHCTCAVSHHSTYCTRLLLRGDRCGECRHPNQQEHVNLCYDHRTKPAKQQVHPLSSAAMYTDIHLSQWQDAQHRQPEHLKICHRLTTPSLPQLHVSPAAANKAAAAPTFHAAGSQRSSSATSCYCATRSTMHCLHGSSGPHNSCVQQHTHGCYAQPKKTTGLACHACVILQLHKQGPI
jgi:hypothetical protein